VDGYFIDQSSPGCDDQPYYQALHDYIKARSSTLRVVLDPGAAVPECYATAADTLVTFQDTLAAYEGFAPQSWEAGYPRELFWHLVYGAQSLGELERTFDLAEARHVGFMFVTDDGLPDPWDTLPGDAYWMAELARATP
jgi:hypothetical protein